MLKWLALIDWASAVGAAIDCMRHAPVTGFCILADNGTSTRHLREILGDRGIPVYGVDMRVSTIRFSVPRAKAAWTERTLSDYGIPYQMGRR